MTPKSLFSHIKWILLVFLIKGVLFVFFAFNFQDSSYKVEKNLFVWGGETSTYYNPLDHISKGKGYSWQTKSEDNGRKIAVPSTRRMPGLLPFYLFFDLFMDGDNIKIAMIFLQFTLGCISVYLLALTGTQMLKNDQLFFPILILLALSTYSSIYHHYALTESLTTSFLIFCLFFLSKYLNRLYDWKYLITLGVLCAWTIFLRPPMGLILPVFGLILISHLRKIGLSWRHCLFKGVLFILPFLILDGAWTYRNYKIKEKWIPLEDDVYESMPGRYTPQLKSVRGLIRAWGGNRKPWRENSEMNWFFSPVKKAPSFPDYYYCSGFNKDSILKLKKYFLLSYGVQVSDSISKEHASTIAANLAHKYTMAYKKEKPIRYYIIAPLRSTLNLFVINPNLALPFPPLKEMNLFQKLFKGGYWIWANIIFIGGFMGMLLFLKNWKKFGAFKFLPLLPISYCIVLGAILFNVENRYLVPFYPLFLIFFVYLCGKILNWMPLNVKFHHIVG